MKHRPPSKRKALIRWRKKNPARIKAITARWRKKNPDKVAIYRRRSRDRRRGASGSYSEAELKDRLVAFGYVCWVPWCSIRYQHLDHGTPVTRLGDNKIDNIYPMCEKHNIQKGDKTLGEYVVELYL